MKLLLDASARPCIYTSVAVFASSYSIDHPISSSQLKCRDLDWRGQIHQKDLQTGLVQQTSLVQ